MHPTTRTRQRRSLPPATRLLPCAACAALLMHSLAHAGPAQPVWSVQAIPTFGGTTSVAYSINNNGWVTGYATQADGSQRGYVWKPDGSMTMIPTLGGNSSVGRAINQAGQVGGWAARADGLDGGFIYDPESDSFSRTVQTSSPNYVLAVNDIGQFAGYEGLGTQVSPIVGNPSATIFIGGSPGYGLAVNNLGYALGTYLDDTSRIWGIGSSPSTPLISGTHVDMNETFQTTGRRNNIGVQTPILYDAQSGAMKLLETPNGGAGTGMAINNRQQVVGAFFAGEQFFDGSGRALAFLEPGDSRGVDLNSLLPSGSDWLLQDAADINENFQIVGLGLYQGQQRGYVMSLESVVWKAAGSGSFASDANWSYGVRPSSRYGAIIDPAVSVTVTLGAGTTSARSLQVGGTAPAGTARATLKLDDSTLDLVYSPTGLTITPRGIVTGTGSVWGHVRNQGQLLTTDLAVSGTLANAGRLGGNGDPDQRLKAHAIVNEGAGMLQVAGGRTVALHSNIGTFNHGLIDVRSGSTLHVAEGEFHNRGGGQVYLRGGDLLVADRVLNDARIQMEGGVLRAGSLLNTGQVEISYGVTAIHGPVENAGGGRIIVTGTAGSTFYGDFDAMSGSELRVSSAASAVFFGTVRLHSGALLTGAGAKFFEGAVEHVDAAGSVQAAGSVTFGGDSSYTARIGGTAAGLDVDQFLVQGLLTFDGTLRLVSSQSFAAQIGQSFDLFDWGSSAAGFTAIDTSGLVLADGAALDLSRLYVDGTVSVTAVPEPSAWLLMLTGTAVLLARRRSGLIGSVRRRP